jgi:TATA-box binding protein (TBP) (component of TFIID and TFIIIB)
LFLGNFWSLGAFSKSALGYGEAKLDAVSIKNLVAKVDLKFPIQLSRLTEDRLHKRYCQSQAGMFPCVNYKIKMLKPNITVRIFGNGVIGFQGADSLNVLYQAVKIMLPLFHQFRLPYREPVDPRSLLGHISHLSQ